MSVINFSVACGTLVSPTPTITPTKTPTPTPTITPPKTPAVTPTPTSTGCPTSYSFCLGYSASSGSLACSDYSGCV